MLKINPSQFTLLAQAINRYAPKLDEIVKIEFGLYLINKYGLDDCLNVNLSNEWRKFNN